MSQEIRHRRLYAFYNSKVLNALELIVCVCLLLTNYTRLAALPVICAVVAVLLFIGYSLWLWIKKPDSIIINRRLSDIAGAYILYYIIICAFRATNELWYIIPLAISVILVFYLLLRPSDHPFPINP